MQQLYFIRTAARNDVSFGLNVSGASTTPGTAVITWPWQGGAPNELWQIPGDGTIISALAQNLYLAPSDDGTTVVTSNSPAYWSFPGNKGPISAHGGNVLTTSEGQLQGSAVQLAAPLDPLPREQNWWGALNILAAPPQFNAWKYITSSLTDSDLTTFVLNVADSDDSLGAKIIVWQLEQNAANSMWQLTPDGRILSAMDRSLLLGASDTGGGPIVLQSAMSPQSGQIWSIDPTGPITSPDTGLSLGIENDPTSLWPGQGPSAVIADPGTSPYPPSFTWQLSPNGRIGTIVAQSPAPFPTFSGAEGDVYSHLMKALEIDDIREQYRNRLVPASEWTRKLGQITCPGTLDTNAWTSVTTQIKSEISATTKVTDFYNSYSDYKTKLAVACNTDLSAIGLLAGFEETGDKTNIGGLLLSVFEGILYTALEAVPGGGAVAATAAILGNVMEGSVNVAMNALNVRTTISASPFQVAYAELWQQIGDAFASDDDAASLMETVILSDWGKTLQFVAAATTSGPNTLSWGPLTTADLIDNSRPGYQISFLKMLLPAKYRIYRYSDDNGDAIESVPSWAQWVTPSTTGKWCKYWIADQENWSAYPVEDLMATYVWANGVAQPDFFQCRNGWGFGTSMVWEGVSKRDNLFNYNIMTLCNQSPNPLKILVTAEEGVYVGPIWPYDQTLPPYGSSAHFFQVTNGLKISIQVEDLAGNVVASFLLHQHQGIAEAGLIWIDNISSNGPYTLSTPLCISGSALPNLSASAQVTISAGGGP